MSNEQMKTELKQLSQAKDIPNLEAYAQRWYILAGAFEIAGKPATAAACHGRWQQYMPMGSGHYIRVVEKPFAFMVKV